MVGCDVAMVGRGAHRADVRRLRLTRAVSFKPERGPHIAPKPKPEREVRVVPKRHAEAELSVGMGSVEFGFPLG